MALVACGGSAESEPAEEAKPVVTEVEITGDNWSEYFEIVEDVTFEKNAFDENEMIHIDPYLKLKDGFKMATWDDLDPEIELEPISFEIGYTEIFKYVTFEKTGDSYQLGEVEPNHEPEEMTEIIEVWVEQLMDEGKTTLRNSHSWTSDENDVVEAVSVWENLQILRATGTIYLLEEAAE